MLNKELEISFKDYLQEKNITTITKESIGDYIASIYYDLYDELNNEEIEEVENNFKKGDKVRITGVVCGYFYNVRLEHCKIEHCDWQVAVDKIRFN